MNKLAKNFLTNGDTLGITSYIILNDSDFDFVVGDATSNIFNNAIYKQN